MVDEKDETQDQLNARMDAIRVSVEDILNKHPMLDQASVLAALMGTNKERLVVAWTLLHLANP